MPVQVYPVVRAIDDRFCVCIVVVEQAVRVAKRVVVLGTLYHDTHDREVRLTLLEFPCADE